MVTKVNSEGNFVTMFYGRRALLGNFVITPFQLDNLWFNCSEQYFQYQKAMFFGDHQTAKAILNSQSPDVQKQLGRQVSGYHEEMWANERESVMEKGCTAKFLQNQNAKNVLLATGNNVLSESTQFDLIWGSGKAIWDRFNGAEISSWNGQNKMGQVLMKVRDLIRDM